MSDLRLESPAFEDGGRIPERYGYTEDDVNPPLHVENVPDGTVSLVLIVDDPDAMEPAGKIWDHWLVWDVDPDIGEIPEDWAADDATEGQNDYGEHGYGGPNPPDREHTYRFRLYALDETLSLPTSTDKDDLEDAMMGQVLANARLEGTYAP
ncbi:YbhB/YbcL family Raf kinase inhibitor-like protein [Halorientalis pallida]|uniref:YbhB/YbcL family Raf kinase inhibitor-like protein n=1 Tax=Halorientalis pallida TaxID=2479928 RepID=A0A498KQ47_9EURY|nr:YbhB/YbcL family Raf kinase inhibitor-like protein [Halorientalis pallida]RXK46217.1 YbhB/YbcL family Raf kinase inhibitor-like protein [Halorientalis pallida]